MKQDPSESTWLIRTVDFLLRRRRSVLLVTAILTALLALSASRLSFTTSPESVLNSSYPELQGLRAHEKDLGNFEHRLILIVKQDDAFKASTFDRLRRVSDAVSGVSGVLSVRSLVDPGFPLPDPAADPDGFRRAVEANPLLAPFLVSRDGRTAALWVELDPAVDAAGSREETVARVRTAAREAGVEPMISGVPAVRIAYSRHIREDLFLLPPLVTAILLLLLFVAFRRPILVLTPLLVVGLASLWTIGFLSLSGGRISVLTSILPSLVLVVGTATTIHVVARFREARFRGLGPVPAAREAMVRMALPCGLTGLTTAVGFSSLLVARIGDVRQFGVYSAVGALLAFLLGLPLTGILLSFGQGGAGRIAPRGDRSFRWLARLLIRRPAAGVLSSGIVVLVSIAGFARLKSETFMLEDVREDAPIHRATSEVDRHLGGVIGFDLVIRSEAGVLRPEVIRFARDLSRRLGALPGVRAAPGPATLLDQAARVAGVTDPGDELGPLILTGIRSLGGAAVARSFISDDGKLARIIVRTGDLGSVRSGEIREAAMALARASRPPGVQVSIGGLTVLAEKVLERLVTEMVRSTVIAFVVIFFLISLLFRSLAVGLLSMVPNFLPMIAAVGFMGLAGITVRSSIALIFAVALGIAVDDTIHILLRYRRERRRGKGVRRSVYATVLWAGRPVVLTSTILFCGFLAFTLSDFKATLQFGLIAAVTIATALVGDILLLPALILIGRRKRGG